MTKTSPIKTIEDATIIDTKPKVDNNILITIKYDITK